MGNELVLDVFHRDAIALVAKHKLTNTEAFIWQAYLKPEYGLPETGPTSGGGEELEELSQAHVAYTVLGVRAM